MGAGEYSYFLAVTCMTSVLPSPASAGLVYRTNTLGHNTTAAKTNTKACDTSFRTELPDCSKKCDARWASLASCDWKFTESVCARKCHPSGMSKFLFFLSWVHELVAFYFTDKEPSHHCRGVCLSTIRESDRKFRGAPIAHSRNRIQRRY